MTDREQVIAELQYMKRDVLEESDKDITLNKAIALLKEQEPSKIVMSTFAEEWYGSTLECTTCGCRWMMSNDDDTCYCPHCGRKVKWDD